MLAAFLVFTWLRSEPPRPSKSRLLKVERLARPSRETVGGSLGAFRLDGIWHLTSTWFYFGGFSSIVPLPGHRLLAVSDSGYRVSFVTPDRGRPRPLIADSDHIFPDEQYIRDVESTTIDPVRRTMWHGIEGDNAILRTDYGWSRASKVEPEAIAGWGTNSGPEAMVRLRDGRFVLLREAFTGWLEPRRHAAVLFAGDPVEGAKAQAFVFDGPDRFAPTDMAQMPDGRVLILMRRLVWPMPQRFAGRIAIADPREIRPGKPWRTRTVAYLNSSLPVDNFEGMAIVPDGGRLSVWIISDDNFGAFQRTLLWKLSVDPRKL
ncbi:esterase-like activity of phytase family protein [Novosphingobium sp. PC22D]|uniref:esterase-like activity of phytase family protein n=1 Tax=Novosphingobium sp. PC22D TaxID=1962403 RepID=UPI001F0AF25C|nr:esterase-like activity of phytase family protein [Novosphingobium sp. PC22D]